jgi:DNA-binding transcriptional LysR family regulator
MHEIRHNQFNQADGAGKGRKLHNARPHDSRKLRVSLKQWRILHAVVDCGGFADAAQFLHLSQSSISYTISRMQEQLNLQLLKIEGRKAHLTEAGRVLLNQSRHLLKSAIELEEQARGLKEGCAEDIRLAVDHSFPVRQLMRALARFAEAEPGRHVQLSEVAMSEIEGVLREREVDLAIGSKVPLGFMGDLLTEVDYAAVAHPAHCLFKLGRALTAADLRRQVRVAIQLAPSPETAGNGGARQGECWSVSSFDTALEAVCCGLGYAWLPLHRIQNRIEQGALACLPLVDGGSYSVNLFLIHGRSHGASPEASRLAELLRSSVSRDPGL